MRYVTAPKARLRPLLKILEDMVAVGHQAALTIEDAEQPSARFDLAIFMRAINGVKSISLLLEQAHWENAAAVARQLFDMLVNVEHLGRLPDRDEAVLTYCWFGVFQRIRQQQRRMLYDQARGRPIDAERLQWLASMLDESFPEFRTRNGTGWKTSWSGKNTRELARLSDNPLRLDQYELMFRDWSEQAHAAPGSLLDSVFRSTDTDWISESVASDDREIADLVTMTVTLFVELWRHLPELPPLPGETALSWTGPVIQFVTDTDPGARTRRDEVRER